MVVVVAVAVAIQFLIDCLYTSNQNRTSERVVYMYTLIDVNTF